MYSVCQHMSLFHFTPCWDLNCHNSVNLLFSIEAADPIDRYQSGEAVNKCNEGNDGSLSFHQQ